MRPRENQQCNTVGLWYKAGDQRTPVGRYERLVGQAVRRLWHLGETLGRDKSMEMVESAFQTQGEQKSGKMKAKACCKNL